MPVQETFGCATPSTVQVKVAEVKAEVPWFTKVACTGTLMFCITGEVGAETARTPASIAAGAATLLTVTPITFSTPPVLVLLKVIL